MHIYLERWKAKLKERILMLHSYFLLSSSPHWQNFVDAGGFVIVELEDKGAQYADLRSHLSEGI